MKMHALSCGCLRMRRRIYLPDARPEESIDLPVASYLLRHRQANVLFDTGCHPLALSDPEARWGSMAKLFPPVSKPEDNLLESLGAINVTPEDIDLVICSHLHPDHCGCNVFFTRATILCHARELEAAKSADAARRGYLANDWDHPQTFDLVEGMRDLFSDGRIVVVPLPGHTPGTMGALVALDRSGSFLLASDAVPIRATLAQHVTPRNTWNVDVLHKTLDEIRHMQAGGTTVICGHDEAEWRSLRKGADAYD
jgi:glyoxylase-like metal-dependent hydrolase (beta-lactamase superfamily II)